ncbi:MAG: metallophosphoesterase family protein [Candidatus Nanohaloarchaea archaeon]|nr:metallophosphoesterase family protein [Candidatus Nanohaloarchaea archaeon]
MLVLSDIHANLPALEAVLADAGDHDTVVCCGDLVGYYTWPDAVVQRVRDEGMLAVRGNHDEAVVTESSFGFTGAAAEAVRWTRDRISDDARSYLEDLPYTRRDEVAGADVFVAHGSPRRPVEEYVYPEQVDARFLQEQSIDVDVLLLGHTHTPMVEHVQDTLVVNPGSAGQPRDGDPRASYAVVDPDAATADIRRVEYDVKRVQDAVRAAGLPAELADRLSRGR